MTAAEALDKIRKLLRMKRGGTPAEIETALALAADLARKHGINLDGVDPDHEPAQPIHHIDSATSARLQWECKFAALICQTFFNVETLVRKLDGTSYRGWGGRIRGTCTYCITLIGTSWDTQIAIHVYNFLVYQFRQCWKTRRGRARHRHAFMHGMYHGICEKLDEQRTQAPPSDTALILISHGLSRRRDYLQKTFGETSEINTTPDADAHTASLAGYLAGRDTNIRPAINSNGRSVPLLS